MSPLSLASYRTLGRSGLRVSPMALGTMTFGEDWGWGASGADSEAILRRYLEGGGNFIDTANIYTKGHSEVILGDYFVREGGRDRVVLATKFCGNLHPGDPNGGGAGRKGILRQLESSLRRLRTDYVDLYWMHFNDPHTPMDETMSALDDLVRAGKVRYIGMSDTPAWRVAEAQVLARVKDWTPLIGLQIEYSLMERTVEADLMACAKAFGLGVTPWSPLKGGLLTGKYRRDQHPDQGRHVPGSKYLTESSFKLIDTLVAVAEEAQATPTAVALRWVLDRPGVASPILGVRSLPQLEGNLEALAVTLSTDQRARLDVASAPVEVFPHTFLPNTRNVMQSGAEVNGVGSVLWPLAPKHGGERW